jgi:predicted RNase H-like nuclease
MDNTEHGAPLVAVGADGAPRGWLLACLYADASVRRDAMVWQTQLVLAADIEAVATFRDRAGAAAHVAIDVPIGLPDSVRFRRCDEQARDLLGKRRNAVFAPPARYMLAAAGDYGRIRELVERERERDPAAKSLSAQAAGITRKVREVDDFVRADRASERWLWECHPELSFRAMNDGAVPPDKHRASGVLERLRLVRAVFPDAEERLAAAPWGRKEATLSDILDAYAALTSALACVREDQEELGDGERDAGEDLPMRMVF